MNSDAFSIASSLIKPIFFTLSRNVSNQSGLAGALVEVVWEPPGPLGVTPEPTLS